MPSDFYTEKRVLVAGGAGFIGSHVVELLLSRGATVTVPVRLTTNLANLVAVRDRITIVTADLAERAAVDAAMRNQDVVFDFTMAARRGILHSARHHASMFRDTLFPFLNLIESARLAGVDRFVVTSSPCVYPRDVSVPMPESEGFRDHPESGNEGFGWAKRMEEYLGIAYAQEYGMNIAIARPANCYGPRDNFWSDEVQVIPSLARRVLRGENPITVWGSGKQTRSFIYVTDLARGILDLGEKYAVAEPVNLGSSEEVSIGDLARIIVEQAGLHTRLVFDTSKPEGHSRRLSDTRTADAVLGGASAIPLREGIKKTMAWYQHEKTMRGML